MESYFSGIEARNLLITHAREPIPALVFPVPPLPSPPPFSPRSPLQVRSLNCNDSFPLISSPYLGLQLFSTFLSLLLTCSLFKNIFYIYQPDLSQLRPAPSTYANTINIIPQVGTFLPFSMRNRPIAHIYYILKDVSIHIKNDFRLSLPTLHYRFYRFYESLLIDCSIGRTYSCFPAAIPRQQPSFNHDSRGLFSSMLPIFSWVPPLQLFLNRCAQSPVF